MRCEGWRRNGGAFTLGPVKWEQCKNDAIAIIKVVQDGKAEDFPACSICWKECIDKGIEIKGAQPVVAD